MTGMTKTEISRGAENGVVCFCLVPSLGLLFWAAGVDVVLGSAHGVFLGFCGDGAHIWGVVVFGILAVYNR